MPRDRKRVGRKHKNWPHETSYFWPAGSAAGGVPTGYDGGQWPTAPGWNVVVQIVDCSGQNQFHENVSKEWSSRQPVHDVILLISDIIQPRPELWERIAVYQGDVEITGGSMLGVLADNHGIVHLTVKRVTVFSSPEARCFLSEASVCWDAHNVKDFHDWMKLAQLGEERYRAKATISR